MACTESTIWQVQGGNLLRIVDNMEFVGKAFCGFFGLL